MHVLKRIGWVALTGFAGGLPGAIFAKGGIDAPLWYTLLVSLAMGAGIGAWGAFMGWLILVAARDRPDGGLRPAIVTAALVGLLCSWFATRVTG